jgi:Uma2 family endonuclease
MAELTISLPAPKKQTAFNLQRWSQLHHDPELARTLAKFEGRIETDRYGHIIMIPPPGTSHGGYQCEIAYLLRTLMPEGRALTECPISTAEGVKAADAVWASRSRFAATDRQMCLTKAPEICVEVLSPSNTAAEMAEKKALYFAAGAKEVWFCDGHGKITFFVGAASRGQKRSKICPKFPGEIRL